MSMLSRWTPVSRWDPFKELEEFQKRLAPILGRGSPVGDGGEREAMTVSQWAPMVDISEDAKEYLIKAEIPEVKREDLKVSVENGVLSISGERRLEKEEKDKKYHRIERSYGSFVRSFTLPDGTDAAGVAAEFKDGVLQVRLPKSEKAKPKSVDVKVQ